MKIISSSVHGIIDYLAAIALIVGPFLLFPSTTDALTKFIPVAAGVALIIYSLITDYSAGARRLIPFPVHLAIDFTAGAAFVVLAFILGLSGVPQLFYLVMGGAVILVVLLTDANVGGAGVQDKGAGVE